MTDLTMRPAQAADEDFLFELYRDTRAEEMAAWGWDEKQQRMFLNLQFKGQSAHYAQYPDIDHRIVLDGGKPIGRIFLSRRESVIILVDIALLPEYRGRGIGGALIEELLGEAERTGKSVQLHVVKINRAQNLYRRFGFEIVEDAGSHWKMLWPGSPPKSNHRGESRIMLDSLHYEDYAPYLNTKFQAWTVEATPIELELIGVEDKSPTPRQEQFVLTFLAPLGAPTSQQIFRIEHEQLGEGSIFLVPIARDASGVTYEAVFNRVRSVEQ